MRQLLMSHPDVEIAGEADSGVQTMELSARLAPDVILLDIQMPGCSGIDVAACLRRPRPHLIFCTAYDQYAVEAFELHAVDYLLKPVVRARLAQALDRIRSMPANDPTPAVRSRSTRLCGSNSPLRPVFWFVAALNIWSSARRACCTSEPKGV